MTDRVNKICSGKCFHKQLQIIKKFASWNGYPKNVVNGIIKTVLNKRNPSITVKANDEKIVYIHLQYAGEKGEHLVRNTIKKLKHCTLENVKFVTRYSVKKLSFFTNTKDKIPFLSKSAVVYQFRCPGCQSCYIGKTDRTLFERTREHCFKDSAIASHIDECTHFKHIIDIHNIHNDDVIEKEFILNQIRTNTNIIDQSENWNILLYKEALHIKERKPSLNTGVRASREMLLF